MDFAVFDGAILLKSLLMISNHKFDKHFHVQLIHALYTSLFGKHTFHESVSVVQVGS